MPPDETTTPADNPEQQPEAPVVGTEEAQPELPQGEQGSTTNDDATRFNLIDDEQKKMLDSYFTYHPPTTDDQKARYKLIRDCAKVFAGVVLNCTPKCADQSAAIRKVREAVMTANAAIACNE
jgi:hypothetical protein